ncbi:hypothetical protein [Actinomycetospora sp.]|uniref:hypothetical protein n=1 Tax=Actinomycetospora sp. TaxID=1872135 RepID=UPI002F414507
MARSRHALRVHPLRSRGVVVGVPVAAAVAFGAHAVLGVTPLSDHQDTQASSSAPRAGEPVQSYGLAPSPPPTTLGLLSAPSTTPAAPAASDASHPSTAAGSQTSKVSGSSTAQQIAAPARSVPIARAASAPARASAPSMMSFAPAPAVAAKPAAETHDAAPQTVQRAAAPATGAAPEQHGSSDGKQSSSGGALLGVDLGVAKVSVLSFGG